MQAGYNAPLLLVVVTPQHISRTRDPGDVGVYFDFKLQNITEESWDKNSREHFRVETWMRGVRSLLSAWGTSTYVIRPGQHFSRLLG